MLKEAIQYFYERLSEAATAKNTHENEVKQVPLPSNGRKLAFVHKGVVTQHDVPPPIRSHKVNSVADLIAAANKWGQDVVVWVSDSAIVLVIDDEDRRDVVTLSLLRSAVFKALAGLNDASVSKLEQASLIRLLRREFRHGVGVDVMLAAVRKLKFRQSSEGVSTIQHGNESMGNSIEAEVTGASDIPDALVVPANVYSNPGEDEFSFQVWLDLEIDAQAKRFILRPMPDEIENAVSQAVDGIKDRIVEALPKATVLYGSPS